jgi:hypothetical protein
MYREVPFGHTACSRPLYTLYIPLIPENDCGDEYDDEHDNYNIKSRWPSLLEVVEGFYLLY